MCVCVSNECVYVCVCVCVYMCVQTFLSCLALRLVSTFEN